MPVRLLSAAHVRRELEKLKCRKTKDYETATGWLTASEVLFIVPHEGPDKRTDENTLREILIDVANWNLFTGREPPEPK